MLTKPVLSSILENDALTRGLADPEARILVEWLVERAEEFDRVGVPEEAVHSQVNALCRKARAISRFVNLWCHARTHGAAAQLAAAERLNWPLPTSDDDPCEIMQNILNWEARQASDQSTTQTVRQAKWASRAAG